MPMSPELSAFTRNWCGKADKYSSDDINGAFDKFFTLYVAFNRLYAEATFRLARRGDLSLKDCFSLRDKFPDSNGAQKYVLRFCGANRLIDAWESDPETNNAFDQIAEHIRQNNFALKLDMATGDQRREKDLALLDKLKSKSKTERTKAGLEALYAIRCNMFHGLKAFRVNQLEVLRPAIVLLQSTITVLQQALEEDDS